MEVLVILALVAIGTIWYFNAKGSKTTAEPEAAPYKVETPTLSEMAEKAEVVATKPAAVKAKAPVKRAVTVKAKAPAKTAAKKPVAKKTVSSKKPV
jgi:DNA-binding protein HU-beta